MITYEEMLDRDLEWALREGSMHFDESSSVHKTLRKLCERLEELGIDYAIMGGMALFFHGYRRFTEDVNLLVTPEGLERIHEELGGRGYLRPFDASKNLRDTDTKVRIDFLVTGQYPGRGEPDAIAFPIPMDVSTTLHGIRVVTIPRLVELKIASGRRKDLADVQELIRVIELSREFATQLHPKVQDTYTELWDELQDAPPSR
mgnify:CR=1 FL=1